VAPGQLCNKLLHNRLLGPRLGERAHIFKVAQPEALDAREPGLEIMGQPVDDFGAPALGVLTGEDIATDRPVEQDELAVDSECGPRRSQLMSRQPSHVFNEIGGAESPQIHI